MSIFDNIITNSKNNTVVNGDQKQFLFPLTKDDIKNTGTNVTINALTDNDTIDNSGANGLINGGPSNDSIYNTGANSSINGNEDNDSIGNNGNSVTIDGGTGNDSILRMDQPVINPLSAAAKVEIISPTG